MLKVREGREVAREMSIAWTTLGARVSDAYQVLGALAHSLPKDRLKRMFRSVYEYEFGDEVRTSELTECLFGSYDRRGIQTIALKWIHKVKSVEIDFPMPRKKGKFWVWTKEEAEAWRKWFAEGWKSKWAVGS